MTRTFAQDTSVPVGRTRGEIDELLRAWGCDAIQWSDDYRAGAVTLRFVWERQGQRYLARIVLALKPPQTYKDAYHARKCGTRHAEAECYTTRHRLSDGDAAQVADQGVRAAHRVLLLWIRAALNAVEAGIIPAEVVFLPFLEGCDGRTVAEVALPRMAELLLGSADRLLPRGAP